MSEPEFIQLYQLLNPINKSQFVSYVKQVLKQISRKKNKPTAKSDKKNDSPPISPIAPDINFDHYIKTKIIYQNNQMFYQDEFGNLFHPKNYNITLGGATPPP